MGDMGAKKLHSIHRRARSLVVLARSTAVVDLVALDLSIYRYS
eukprot:COSAG05_NODE_544_length_8777_cov_13.472805_2_plen_43_part_00